MTDTGKSNQARTALCSGQQRIVEQYAEVNMATQKTSITIPMAPLTVNTLYRVYRGRQILSKRGRAWYAEIAFYLGPLKARYEVPVRVSINVWPSSKRAYDIDNVSKGILDALVKNHIIKDDVWVYRLHLIKHDRDKEKHPAGAIWIDIQPLRPYLVTRHK